MLHLFLSAWQGAGAQKYLSGEDQAWWEKAPHEPRAVTLEKQGPSDKFPQKDGMG